MTNGKLTAERTDYLCVRAGSFFVMAEPTNSVPYAVSFGTTSGSNREVKPIGYHFQLTVEPLVRKNYFVDENAKYFYSESVDTKNCLAIPGHSKVQDLMMTKM